MKITCDVIQDLIPLVQDDTASEDSRRLVEEHVAQCPDCRNLQEPRDLPPPPTRNEAAGLRAIKKSLFYSQAFILLAGSCIGIALSNSMGMFYNILLMPLLGILSVSAFRRRWLLVPLFVFLLTSLWQFFAMWLDNGRLSGYIFTGSLLYAAVYTGLVLAGVAVALLLRFAFRKEVRS